MTLEIESNRTGTLTGEGFVRRIDLLIDQLTSRGERFLLRELRRRIRKGPFVQALRDLQAGKPLSQDLMDRLAFVQIDEEQLQEIFNTAYKHGARATSSAYKNLVQFDPESPGARYWLNTQSARKVQEISEQTRAGIRNLLARAVEQGYSPEQLAESLRSSIGLTFRQTELVEAYRQRMLQSGVASPRANRRAFRYGESLLSQRIRAIAETEITSAVEQAKLEYWDQARTAGLLNDQTALVWITERDSRVDEMCAGMAFQAVPLNGGMFHSPVGLVRAPPIHPLCRCQVVLEAGSAATSVAIGQIQTTGGFTTHLVTGHDPPDGWMVALPGNEESLPLGEVTEDWINDYKQDHRQSLSRPGYYWGGWLEQTGDQKRVYLDVARNVKGFDEAVQLGKLYRQKAIYDLSTGETLNLATMTITKTERLLVGWVIPFEWSGKRVREELRKIDSRYLR